MQKTDAWARVAEARSRLGGEFGAYKIYCQQGHALVGRSGLFPALAFWFAKRNARQGGEAAKWLVDDLCAVLGERTFEAAAARLQGLGATGLRARTVAVLQFLEWARAFTSVKSS